MNFVVLKFKMRVLLFVVVAVANALYCEELNCYEVMGVERTAEKRQIRRAYRKLSLKVRDESCEVALACLATRVFAFALQFVMLFLRVSGIPTKTLITSMRQLKSLFFCVCFFHAPDFHA